MINIKRINATWICDPKDGSRKLLIAPNKDLMDAIDTKEFVVDELFGCAPTVDLRKKNDETRFKNFVLEAIVQYADNFLAYENPAKVCEEMLDSIDVIKKWIMDLEKDRFITHHEYMYKKAHLDQMLEDLQKKVYEFCV